MATIGNNPDSFLHALSDFWVRFFADIGDLRATYEGTSVLFGQAYLDLLGSVLNVAANETPLFRKEYYRLIVVREDQVFFDQNFRDSAKSRWVFLPTDVELRGVAALQNKVYAPDAVLEVGPDIDAFEEGVHEGQLRFVVDPTADTSAPPLSSFATRTVQAAVGGSFSATGVDWVTAGVKKGDRLWTHPYATLPQGNRVLADAQSFYVVHVTADELRLSLETPAPEFPMGFSQTPVSWWVDRAGFGDSFDATLPCTDLLVSGPTVFNRGTFGPSKNIDVTEISLWAVDALVDDKTLYKNFGSLLGKEGTSTEAYRALVRGLMQLYLFGPAIDRLESALNVVAFLPVARSDDEVLTAYEPGVTGTWNGVNGSFAGGLFNAGVALWSSSDVGGFVEVTLADDARNVGVWAITEVVAPNIVRLEPPAGVWPQASGVRWEYSKTDVQVVVTTKNRYELDRRLPIRADIADPASIGVLTFKAFETLSTAIRVVDYIRDPTWWHDMPIPEELLPGKTLAQRVAGTRLLVNKIGADFEGHIGDPGFYIGANEEGVVAPSGAQYRHRPAFILMDRFLSAHVFQVSIDRNVLLSANFVAELSDTMQQAKPAYTYAFLLPGTQFTEAITVIDAVDAAATRQQFEALTQQAHTLTIGGGWAIGAEWRYVTTVMAGATLYPHGSGYVPLFIGGLNPAAALGAQGITAGVFESPLYVLPV